VKDLLTVFVGSGVGSAIIASGQLVHGAHGVAGEFGHIKVMPGGRRCGCGERGCLEAYAGGHNLIAQMREELDAGRAPYLKEIVGYESPTPAHLERAALAGDRAASAIYEQAIEYLGICLGNQITMLNPARVVLGGGVLNYTQKIRARVEERSLQIALAASRRSLEIREAALGDDSGIIGAALLASH
jgi:glucokinase